MAVDNRDKYLTRRSLLRGALAGGLALATGGLEQALAADSELEAAGDRLLLAGDPSTAAQKYAWHLKHNPSDADAFYKFGFALGEIGKHETGLKAFRKAYSMLEPKQSQMEDKAALRLLRKGGRQLYRGDIEGALQLFEQSMAIEESWSTHNAIAYANLERGIAEGVREHLVRSFIIHPGGVHALSHMSDFERSQGNYPNALYFLEARLIVNTDPADQEIIRAKMAELREKRSD